MSQHTLTFSDDNFSSQVLENPMPVLVDFWAPWCGPCVAISDTIDELATEYHDKVAIGKFNVDEHTDIPARYSVRSIPYLALFHKGELVDSIVGSVAKAQIVAMFAKVNEN